MAAFYSILLPYYISSNNKTDIGEQDTENSLQQTKIEQNTARAGPRQDKD